MNTQRQILLLGGSPKGDHSTSESLGDYLLSRLVERGCAGNKLRIHSAMKTEERQKELLSAVSAADLVVLSFPLYVDSLPAPVIAALELIARTRREKPALKPQGFLAIVNSGFPEAHQSDNALAICRRFAAEAGFEWAGGLALGGGPAIDGKPLLEVGGRAHNMTQALDMAAAALAEGQPVPPEATQLMAKSVVPAFLYALMGNMGWKKQAKQNGADKKLRDRPFAA